MYMECTRNVMECTWNVYGMCTECIWNVHGMYMELWNVYGMYTECIWNVHGMYMECIWNVYGMYMECTWRCTEVYIEFIYNPSSESGRSGASIISFLCKAQAISAFPINLLRVTASSMMLSFFCRFLEDCTRRPLLVHCTGRLSLNLSVSTTVNNANPGIPSLAHCCHH